MNTSNQILDFKPRPVRGVFLLLGASGSGKGTIAKQLLALGIVKHHISMGELLRGTIERINTNPNVVAAGTARNENHSRLACGEIGLSPR